MTIKSSAILLFLVFALSASKSLKVSTAVPNIISSMKNDYYSLKSGENLFDFVNKKICFVAKIAEIPA